MTQSARARAGAFAALLLLPLVAGCTGPIELADDASQDAGAKATYLTVVVHKGDTISAIAARYDVSAGTLVRMNGLADGNAIVPGEQLRVPADSAATRRAVFREADAPNYASWNAPGAAPTHAVSVREEPPASTNARTATAMPKSVSVESLDAPKPVVAAPVKEPKHLAQLDEDLKEAAAEAQPMPAVVASRNEQSSPPQSDDDSDDTPAPAATKPSVEHHQTKVASRDTVSSHGVFEWPVQGRIILPFGGGDDGVKNDGINIAAQMGEPIRAAAAGTVIYAGNELKGYGNLVLIRHDNGYTTAYAHAETLLVSRGDTVKQGQTIAYAGDTGDVRTPQVHFEIRQGVKPVDPKPLLLASRDS